MDDLKPSALKALKKRESFCLQNSAMGTNKMDSPTNTVEATAAKKREKAFK